MAEKNVMTPITSIAPTKAASRMARKPPIATPSAVSRKPIPQSPREMVPPKASITTATARPAPLLMPKTSGPARGLRNAVWRSSPLVENRHDLPPRDADAAPCQIGKKQQDDGASQGEGV